MMNFFKPTKKKIIWSVVLFIFLIYLSATLLTYFYDVDLPIFLDILYWAALWPALLFALLINFLSSPEKLSLWIIIIGGLVLEAVYSYSLICLISSMSKRNKGKRKR